MKNIKNIFSNNIFILSFLFKYIPVYVLMTIILFIAKGLLQSLSNVWLVEKVIDGIMHNTSYVSIITPVLIFSSYALVVGLFNAIFLEISEKIYKQKFSDKMRMSLYEKAIKCDISCYDNTEFYNNFIWSANEIDHRAFSVFQSLAMFIQRITVISSTLIILTKINIWILLVVLFSCIVNSYFTIKQNKVQFKLSEKLNVLSCRKNYVNRTFILPDYAKELRTSKISDILYSMFFKTNNNMKAEIKYHSTKIWKYDLLKKIIGEDIVVTFTSVIVLSWQVLVKTISVGSFMASYNGIQMIYSSLSFLLGRASSFAESSLYIDKFKSFWFYKPSIEISKNALIPSTTKSIQFQNVDFTYGKQESVLKNISLYFSKSQKIAIVGSNGAGKTTLIKLLLRLYDPNKGNIFHNHIDIKNLNTELYKKHFSCLFQDFNLYSCTLGENIAMDTTDTFDTDKLNFAISNSGFASKFKSLDNGINSILTKEFDDKGLILSGGEKQKLAIARLIYKDADCYILDEPTAALDPIAEVEFNRSIMTYSENKLLIIISHRLTVTRFVDKIIVIDNGEIVESGTHDELIKCGGKYSKLYSLQASQYNQIR